MAHEGQEIVNPRTGQRLTFPRSETRPRYLSRRESRRSLRTRPSVWQCGQ